MKIKLHNSLAKNFKGLENEFIFDEKIAISFERLNLRFRYKIDDVFFFLGFSIISKEFETEKQFGMKIDQKDSFWWKRWKKNGWIQKEITNDEN